jgi:hypothetical protein
VTTAFLTGQKIELRYLGEVKRRLEELAIDPAELEVVVDGHDVRLVA